MHLIIHIFDVNKENTYDLFSIQFASGNQGLGSSLAAYITASGLQEHVFRNGLIRDIISRQDFRVDTLLVQEMKNARDKRLETSVADGFGIR